MALSETSLLLLKRWEAVRDLLQAEQQLRSEFADILERLPNEVRGLPGIERGAWEFIWQSDYQVYFSKKKWEIDGEFPVWIGVEGFSAEAVFGDSSPPIMYVWVSRRRLDLAKALSEAIEESGCKIVGQVDRKTSGYVIKKPVRKYFPNEVDSFERDVTEEIVGFVSHWIPIVGQHDRLIMAHI